MRRHHGATGRDAARAEASVTGAVARLDAAARREVCDLRRRHVPVTGTIGGGAFFFAPGSGPELRHRYRCPPLKEGNVAVVDQGAARRRDAPPRRERRGLH